jgi:aryl-alcohol dehydrogenase-like predicted oxidoreductase
MTERDRPLKFKKFQLIWAEWDRWLLSINLTPLQACLAYILSVKEIDKLIVGIDGLPQLKEIVAAVGMQLSSYPQWPKKLPSNLINPSKWDEL